MGGFVVGSELEDFFEAIGGGGEVVLFDEDAAEHVPGSGVSSGVDECAAGVFFGLFEIALFEISTSQEQKSGGVGWGEFDSAAEMHEGEVGASGGA